MGRKKKEEIEKKVKIGVSVELTISFSLMKANPLIQ